MSCVDSDSAHQYHLPIPNSSAKSFDYTAFVGRKWDELSLVSTLQVVPEVP
jgi:hypothetical protein